MMAENRKSLLLDESSDSDVDFHINEDYAHRYEKWRKNEELQKLKDKYGSLSSSSSESEDDIPGIEKDFFKTLSLLKSKDPKIYDEKVHFFNEKLEKEVKSKEKKPKPLYIKDYERKVLLEKNGESSSEDDISHNVEPTYDEELHKIQESFKPALEDSDSDDEGESSLLQVRQKSKVEKDEEDEKYVQWLKGNKEDLSNDDSDNDLKCLHDFWNDPNLGDDEQFLKNYILNKQFAEENKSEKVPTFDEITNLSDDEKLLEKQAVFEHKYNFRFEEPDSEFIKKYPRTIGDSLRRKDTRRKLKREEYQERKQQEKEQKMEEIKRLKALKRAEIEEKISKLKGITGSDKLGFVYADIDGDFDPNEHDKRMKELFNDDYYEVEEPIKPVFSSDEDCDGEDWDAWTGGDMHKNHYEQSGPHCEDPEFNMDADYDPRLEFEKQMIESQTRKSKKKKKSKFAAAISNAKPVFDPSLKPFEQYFDEYYKLDCEDIIGDLPVRFKYRKVVPNDFGLTTEEILSANDKELNKWCSLKKTMQFRPESEEIYDLQAFKKKAQDFNKKKKILISLYEEPESEDREDVLNSSHKKPRKRKLSNTNSTNLLENNSNTSEIKPDVKHIKPENGEPVQLCVSSEVPSNHKKSSDNSVVDSSHILPNSTTSKKKRKKKKKKAAEVQNNIQDTKLDGNVSGPAKSSRNERFGQNKSHRNANKFQVSDKRLQLSDSRLEAYGINPKKFKSHIKYNNFTQKSKV